MTQARRLRSLSPYVYIAPAFMCIILVYFYPLARNLYDSFFEISGPIRRPVGLANYLFLLKEDPVFWQAVGNNVRLLLAIPVLVMLAILVAVLLYEQIKGWRLYRFAVFVPYVLSITVVGIVFSYVFRLNGIFNTVLTQVGAGNLVFDWLGDSRLAIYTVIFVIIWREMGFGIILFLARLLSVSRTLYEAAKVEGASWLQMHWHVSIPQLRSVLEFFIIYQIINLFSWVFNYVYVMTGGGPGRATYVTELYIFDMSIKYGVTGMASAISMLLFLAISVLIAIMFRLQRDNGE